MKVLQITTHFNIGGISNYILSLSRALKASHIDIVVASSGGDLESALDKSGIPHRHLNIKTKFEFGPKAISSGFKIAGIVKREGIDLMHAHSRVSQVSAAIASVLTGIPYMTTCHGYFNKRSRKIVDTWGVKVIAISDAVRKHLIYDLGVDESRIELIYSGVDAKAFSGEYSSEEIGDLRRDLDLGHGPVLGTIGRLSSVKGQKHLIVAMKNIAAKIPNVRCLIIGSGPEEEALKDLVNSLGLGGRVKFQKACVDTHKYLSLMDIFVFPSVKEGLGIALLEALASGRPCIASRIGGIEDIITDGVNGILVHVREPLAIAHAAIRLLEDGKLRKKLGEEARLLVKSRFALTSMADDVSKVYKKVAAG